ncbi:hypothetical protein GW17_00006204 [Ensete ventricosum]|nr:hypothetical protein GW17_00006204 [Ensete ventricosum]
MAQRIGPYSPLSPTRNPNLQFASWPPNLQFASWPCRWDAHGKRGARAAWKDIKAYATLRGTADRTSLFPFPFPFPNETLMCVRKTTTFPPVHGKPVIVYRGGSLTDPVNVVIITSPATSRLSLRQQAMSLEGIVERREGSPAGNGNGPVAKQPAPPARPTYGDRRLRLNPNTEHKPERYDDVQSEYDSAIFSYLERHLPPSMLDVSRDAKVEFMKEILSPYLPEGERNRLSLEILNE